MNRKKILLQGYYGFGNLGDDILLLVCYHNLKWHFPEAELVVFVNTEQTSSYLNGLLGENIRTINYSAREHFDFIVHGGGGVHYDYEHGNFLFSVLNRIILNKPSWFTKLYQFYKVVKSKENISTTYRIGLGIGVGTFTPSSRKFYTNVPLLNGYDYLQVRDSASVAAAIRYKTRVSPVVSTDLAFFSEYWHPSGLKKTVEPASKRIGMVLRYWKSNNDYVKETLDVAKSLRDRGFSITFFSFEKVYDTPYSKLVQDDFNLVEWPLESGNLSEFFARFCDHDLIVSSRFHGVILASTFGLPSIALKLDPKLSTLKGILPESAQVLELEQIPTQLESLILATFSDIQSWKESTLRDFERNNKIIHQGMDSVNTFIRERL
ncbi:MAG: polysaccharide pyruvyl transferase family protein [Cyclobacteriaceae bacterium]|nr:polysaccharide pyruvyl transferase family protein [Cyclobacteriaceae bacterium]